MSTDREMLENAAKAAGLPPDQWQWSGHGMRELKVHCVPHCGFSGPLWNPLTDDGDALRLAVTLKMDVCFGANYVIVRGSVQMPLVNNAGDPYAATRSAIVRAAAEIGKQKGEA